MAAEDDLRRFVPPHVGQRTLDGEEVDPLELRRLLDQHDDHALRDSVGDESLSAVDPRGLQGEFPVTEE